MMNPNSKADDWPCSQRIACIKKIMYYPSWDSDPCRLLNTLRPRQNGRYFPDDIFKCIFLNENVRIPFEISLKIVPKGSINNSPALVQIMAWRRSGDKPLSEPMMVSLLTHICVTRPQWVNNSSCEDETYPVPCFITDFGYIEIAFVKITLEILPVHEPYHLS